MEKITEIKFQKLSMEESAKVIGGKKLVSHDSCTGPSDGLQSKTVYSIGWFGQKILGKEETVEEYDEPYDCEG